MLATNCASLLFFCQETSVKSGILGRRPRASLPVPSFPWIFARGSPKGAGTCVSVAFGAGGWGGEVFWTLEESACAWTSGGQEIWLPPKLIKSTTTLVRNKT